MGKYMKKAKAGGEVAVMEVLPHHHQTSLGVRTRARTLALQRRAAPAAAPPPDDRATSYLQLRSRRLEKPPAAPKPKLPPCNEIPNPSTSPSSPSPYHSSRSSHNGAESIDAGVEVSFGENVVDVEARGRNARETTPCSLIRDSETIGTPGSTTRPTNSTAATRRTQNSIRRNIPTSQEMEEFFSEAEQPQQRMFAEKYNFDPMNDLPLPGRYEWVKLDEKDNSSS